jgi:hypothetical protein
MTRIAELLARRNEIDAEIASIMKRPMATGHLGEWIAARVFNIRLEDSATAPGIDGRFLSARLADRTVTVKWYLKDEGLLDVSTAVTPDFYLVLAGPKAPAVSSKGSHRPWVIERVYLLDGASLMAQLGATGCRIGVATSVRQAIWKASEIYPLPTNPDLPLEPYQRAMLGRFLPKTATQPEA